MLSPKLIFDQLERTFYLSSCINKYMAFSPCCRKSSKIIIFFAKLVIKIRAIFGTHCVPEWPLIPFSGMLETRGESEHDEFLSGNI